MLAGLGSGAALYKLEELLHAVASGWLEFEFYPHSEARIALDHDAV
jgi:hypothetical protein